MKLSRPSNQLLEYLLACVLFSFHLILRHMCLVIEYPIIYRKLAWKLYFRFIFNWRFHWRRCSIGACWQTLIETFDWNPWFVLCKVNYGVNSKMYRKSIELSHQLYFVWFCSFRFRLIWRFEHSNHKHQLIGISSFIRLVSFTMPRHKQRITTCSFVCISMLSTYIIFTDAHISMQPSKIQSSYCVVHVLLLDCMFFLAFFHTMFELDCIYLASCGGGSIYFTFYLTATLICWTFHCKNQK